MKDWVANKKPEFMSVAFRAERSIEDELDRTSQSDVVTVAISYCIMLVYVAIALGQAKSFSRLMVIRRIRKLNGHHLLANVFTFLSVRLTAR